MKWVTFALAFILTICLIIGGVAVSPILRQAATTSNDYVFAFFLGPFAVVLFFAWIGEKVVLKLWKHN
jgi:hypothetical protein